MLAADFPLPPEARGRISRCHVTREHLERPHKCRLYGLCDECASDRSREWLGRDGALRERLDAVRSTKKGFLRLSFPIIGPSLEGPDAGDRPFWDQVLPSGKAAAQHAIGGGFGYWTLQREQPWRYAKAELCVAWKLDPLGAWKLQDRGDPPDGWPSWKPSLEAVVPLVKVTEEGQEAIRVDQIDVDKIQPAFEKRYVEELGLEDDAVFPNTVVIKPPPSGGKQKTWRDRELEAFADPYFSLHRATLVEDGIMEYEVRFRSQDAWGKTTTWRVEAEPALERIGEIETSRLKGEEKRRDTRGYFGKFSPRSFGTWAP